MRLLLLFASTSSNSKRRIKSKVQGKEGFAFRAYIPALKDEVLRAIRIKKSARCLIEFRKFIGDRPVFFYQQDAAKMLLKKIADKTGTGDFSMQSFDVSLMLLLVMPEICHFDSIELLARHYGCSLQNSSVLDAAKFVLMVLLEIRNVLLDIPPALKAFDSYGAVR